VTALRGLGRADEVIRAAGPQAVDDFRREAPLAFAAGEVAWVVRTLTPLGKALLAAAGAVAALGLVASIKLAGRQRA
jgi:hypothetical protein